MKKKTLIFVTVLIMSMVLWNAKPVEAYEFKFDENQEQTAEMIAKICTDHWDEYGVLPSVCIAQGFIECQLGNDFHYENNLWGLCSGTASYESLEDGVIAYLECINNGRYDAALQERNPETALNAIWDGGYTETEKEKYVGDCLWAIDTYDLTRYDTTIHKNWYMEQYGKQIYYKKSR